MQIMLTGSSGYIGSKIHAALNAKGDYEVFTFDEFGDKGRWEQRFSQEFNQHFDWIIHAGAIMNPGYTHHDIFWWNYECTRRIVNYCNYFITPPRLLFFSTCQTIVPHNHYAWSKRCAADYVASHVEDYCIVKPFVVFGDEYGRTSQLSAVAKLIKGELPVMFEPWERDWIHVRDVVRAIVHIVDNKINGIYDLGTGEAIAARVLFERWHDGIWGSEIPPVVGPGTPPYPDGAPARLYAKELLPNFDTKYNVLEYLDEMKKYGNKVY